VAPDSVSINCLVRNKELAKEKGDYYWLPEQGIIDDEA